MSGETYLQEKQREMVARLDKGLAMIDQARAEGKDVTRWEDKWCRILRDYEAVCDALGPAAGMGA